MRILLRLVLLVALVVCVVWAIKKPGFDSYAAALGALGMLITTFVVEKKGTATKMSQKVGKGAKGIQAGGNITINK